MLIDVCMKFCFLLGEIAPEIVTMLQEAFKDNVMSQPQVYELFII